MHKAIKIIVNNMNEDRLRDWFMFLYNAIADMAEKQICNEVQSKHMNKIIL